MEELVGHSDKIVLVRKRIRQLSKTSKNVLIVGENGVGKSIVARSIHYQSSHSTKPFVYLSASETADLSLRSITQSILLNHEFANPETSAHGNFPLPEGATIILDGVANTSIPGQRIITDLMRNLADGSFYIRILLLLTSNLNEHVKKGKIIRELSELLDGWETITIPPLRERREDIPELVEHFVRKAAKELRLGEVIIDINAVSLLSRREWKQNVQELKAFVEHAFLLSEDKETFTLPESLVDEQSELASMLRRIDDGVEFALDRSLELIERRIMERVLRKFGFNQSRAARFLKITEDTLRYRMKKLGISSPSEA